MHRLSEDGGDFPAPVGGSFGEETDFSGEHLEAPAVDARMRGFDRRVQREDGSPAGHFGDKLVRVAEAFLPIGQGAGYSGELGEPAFAVGRAEAEVGAQARAFRGGGRRRFQSEGHGRDRLAGCPRVREQVRGRIRQQGGHPGYFVRLVTGFREGAELQGRLLFRAGGGLGDVRGRDPDAAESLGEIARGFVQIPEGQGRAVHPRGHVPGEGVERSGGDAHLVGSSFGNPRGELSAGPRSVAGGYRRQRAA